MASRHVDGRAVLIGKAALLAQRTIPSTLARRPRPGGVGRTPMFVAVNGREAESLPVADTVRPESK